MRTMCAGVRYLTIWRFFELYSLVSCILRIPKQITAVFVLTAKESWLSWHMCNYITVGWEQCWTYSDCRWCCLWLPLVAKVSEWPPVCRVALHAIAVPAASSMMGVSQLSVGTHCTYCNYQNVYANIMIMMGISSTNGLLMLSLSFLIELCAKM